MIKSTPTISKIVIIGCGGVASWLMPPLVKLLAQMQHKPDLILVDGDTIEQRNLERQFFTDEDIGKNKAQATAEKYAGQFNSITFVSRYFNAGQTFDEPVGTALFICCADNHAARRAVLEAVDTGGHWAIIAGNEYTEAESYFYDQRMKGSPSDPRVFYPSILTDNTGDPTRPVGCTGEAAIAAPQLVLANFSAANHALWLFYHHMVERHQMGGGYAREFMPVKTWNFGCRFTTTLMKDYEKTIDNAGDQEPVA